MKNRILLYSLLIATIAGSARETGRGGSAGSFLRMGLGARSLGMGGGAVALADDGQTLYYNPAGLVYLQDRWITSSMHQMALDRHLIFVGYAQAIGQDKEMRPGMMRGGLGLGWLSAGVSQIDSRDYNGTHQGMLSHAEHCFYFAFALNPQSKLAVGISGKCVYSRFPGIAEDNGAFSTWGFGFDLGAVIKPVPSFSVGFVLRDLRTRYTWDSQNVFEQGLQTTDEFPLVMQTGLVWHGLSGRITAHADYKKIQDIPGMILCGAEYSLKPQFLLRAGLEGRSPAFGLGYRGRFLSAGYQLDYAYGIDSVAPQDNHIMTFAVFF
jgi:long-subunit fatty acid transport protein